MMMNTSRNPGETYLYMRIPSIQMNHFQQQIYSCLERPMRRSTLILHQSSIEMLIEDLIDSILQVCNDIVMASITRPADRFLSESNVDSFLDHSILHEFLCSEQGRFANHVVYSGYIVTNSHAEPTSENPHINPERDLDGVGESISYQCISLSMAYVRTFESEIHCSGLVKLMDRLDAIDAVQLPTRGDVYIRLIYDSLNRPSF